MHKTFIIFVVSIILSACSVANYQSKVEARYHLGEQKRVGLLSKDEYLKKIRSLNQSDLPQNAKAPIAYNRIRSSYQAKVRNNRMAAVTRRYNAGQLRKQEYNKLVAANNGRKAASVLGAVALGLAAGYGGGAGLSGSALSGYQGRSSGIGGCYTKRDHQSGNNYYICPQVGGGATVRGSNMRTGSIWNTTIDAYGNQRGFDSKGHSWTYNKASGSYHNFGTGRSCYGTGYMRQCY